MTLTVATIQVGNTEDVSRATLRVAVQGSLARLEAAAVAATATASEDWAGTWQIGDARQVAEARQSGKARSLYPSLAVRARHRRVGEGEGKGDERRKSEMGLHCN